MRGDRWLDLTARGQEPAVIAAAARRQFLSVAASVFAAAVDRCKSGLRVEVQDAASVLFRRMTTDPEGYAGLVINDRYGLAIENVDDGIEDGASEAAPHGCTHAKALAYRDVSLRRRRDGSGLPAVLRPCESLVGAKAAPLLTP